MSEELNTILQKGLADVDSKLKAALSDHTAQIEKNGKASTELTGKIDDMSAQFKEIRDEMDSLAQKQLIAHSDVVNASAGQEFVKSDAFKALAERRVERARYQVKNTVLAGSTTTFPQQNPGVIPGSFVPLTIRSQIPTIQVANNSVNSLRELAWTSSAAERAQDTAKPESALTFEQYNVPVETVAHFIKVSNQLMADAPAIAAYIDTRLRDGLAQRIDSQLLLGTGVAPLLSGFSKAGNFTAFTPTAGANLVESINKAKYGRWAVGEVVDTVIVNPADWAAMEVLREGAGSGTYLYGAPGTAASNPFGLSVVMSPYMPAGKFLIGSLRSSSTIYQREGAVVEMGFVNDDFTKNLITIRAEERLGLAVDRPAGIMYGNITA